jgi:hypothetical protein
MNLATYEFEHDGIPIAHGQIPGEWKIFAESDTPDKLISPS